MILPYLDSNFRDAKEWHYEITYVLHQNPLSCDCYNYGLIQLINEQKSNQYAVKVMTSGFHCKEQYTFEEKSIEKIDLKNFECRYSPNPNEYENKCVENSSCQCYYKPYIKHLRVKCTNEGLYSQPKFNNLKNTREIELQLGSNLLKNFPDMQEYGYEKVNALDLTNNKLEDINETNLPDYLKVR